MSTATVAEIATRLQCPQPIYAALAGSPAAGSDRLYALHSGAIDAIETTRQGGPLVHADEIVLPLGFDAPTAMTTGITAGGTARLYVAVASLLAAFVLPSQALHGPVAVPDAAVALHLSRDGRFLLVTRHPSGSVGGSVVSSVVVLDADTLEILYDSETAVCDPPSGGLCPATIQNPMSLSIDVSHAFSSNPEQNRLAYLYLGPPSLKVKSTSLARAVAAVPVEDFVSAGARQSLIQSVGTVQTLLGAAEKAPTEQAEQALLTQADKKLAVAITKLDGCSGRATTRST